MGAATYEHPLITLEHVLPESPEIGSTWRRWFTDEEREFWLHRLANLVLLTRREELRGQQLRVRCEVGEVLAS